MKQLSLYGILLPLLCVLVMVPGLASAKGGHHDDDEWDDDDDESALEIEADIFTDITVVKVEQNGKKTIFTTDADTRDEVIDAVVAKFSLTDAEVEAVLDLEEEDRASRPQDRGKLNKFMKKDWKKGWGHHWGPHASTTPKVCRDDDTALSIEADVFTDKTIVKMEFVNAKDEVFTTSATTSAAIVDAIAAKYSSLTKSQIEAALDLEVEDRASRDSDMKVDAECKDSTTGAPIKPVNEAKLAELQARITELQTLLNRLLSLMRGN